MEHIFQLKMFGTSLVGRVVSCSSQSGFMTEAQDVPVAVGQYNTFGDLESSNGVHECLRRDRDVQRQLSHFITGFGNVSEAISSFCLESRTRPFCPRSHSHS